jgi:hypothetical protein
MTQKGRADSAEREQRAAKVRPGVQKLLDAKLVSTHSLGAAAGKSHTWIGKVMRGATPGWAVLHVMEAAVAGNVPRATPTRPPAPPDGAVQGMGYLADRIVTGLLDARLDRAISDAVVAALARQIEQLGKSPPPEDAEGT